MYELSSRKRRHQHTEGHDATARATKFKQLFDTSNLPDGWFDSTGTPTRTFDDNCTSIKNMYHRKWYTQSRKAEYTSTFSTSNWMSLPAEEKCMHTVSNCNACSEKHLVLQEAFPGGPVHVAPTRSLAPPPPFIRMPHEQTGSEKQHAKRVLCELNQAWVEQYDHSLTSALPRLCPETNLAHKKTSESKKEDRSGSSWSTLMIDYRRMQPSLC